MSKIFNCRMYLRSVFFFFAQVFSQSVIFSGVHRTVPWSLIIIMNVWYNLWLYNQIIYYNQIVLSCLVLSYWHRTKSHVSVFLKRGGNMRLHVSVMFTSCGNVKIQVYVFPWCAHDMQANLCLQPANFPGVSPLMKPSYSNFDCILFFLTFIKSGFMKGRAHNYWQSMHY